MSFVPNVVSIKMAPLWPYDSMDSHWVGVWIFMVNGNWVPLISTTSWKKNTSFECWRAQNRIEVVGLVCKHQLLFFMFPIQICNVLKPNEIILCHALIHIHMLPPNWNLSLVRPICGPLMLMTCVEHNETYKKWILSHAHHVRMTH